jgi:hypothetical protein
MSGFFELTKLSKNLGTAQKRPKIDNTVVVFCRSKENMAVHALWLISTTELKK